MPPPSPGGYPPQQGGYPPQQGGYPPQQGGYAPPPGGPVQSGSAPPVFVPEVNANLAEPVTRILARVIDGLIVGIPAGIIFAVFSSVFTTTETVGGRVFGVDYTVGQVETTSYLAYLLSGIVAAGIAFGYEVFMTKTQGQTIGKKVMGAQIRRADGQALDQNTIMIRAGVVAAPSLINFVVPIIALGGALGLLIWGASVALLFTDARRETIADKAAKTLVVAVPK